jgi:ubiquitin-protein ligase
VHDGRIYQLKLFCDKDYPEKAPTVRFCSRVNMTCVNQETGRVRLDFYSVLCFFLIHFIWYNVFPFMHKEEHYDWATSSTHYPNYPPFGDEGVG